MPLGNDASAPRTSRAQRTLGSVRRGTPHDLQGRFEAAAPVPEKKSPTDIPSLTLYIGPDDPSSEVPGHGEWDMWFQTAEGSSPPT